jgi:large subunit ribosomal protein L4
MSAKLPVIDLKGKIQKEVEAPANMFAVEANEDVIHFVCEGQRFRFYKKTAHTKTRSMVAGGGKKSRKQKGGGTSRQGGTRAPHWVGGGVNFGPHGMKRDFKVNRKLYDIALASILSDRHSGGQVRILESAELKAPKTKTLSGLLDGLKLKGARVGFVVDNKQDAALSKSVQNIRNVDLLGPEKWTTLDFIKTDSLIFSEAAFEGLKKHFGKTKAKA